VALSPEKALDAARNVYGARLAEANRLNFIAGALNPQAVLLRLHPVRGRLDRHVRRAGFPTVELPKNATPAMQRLAWKARTNFLPLVLKTFSQTMKVDGYPTTKTDVEGGPWSYLWQRTGWTPGRRASTVPRSPTGRRTRPCCPVTRPQRIEGYSPRR
jgi:hypothetical protein